MPLDSLENVKLNLAITTEDDDPLLESLQDAADSFIGTYCDRDFLGGSYTEEHAGNSKFCFLHNFPLGNIASVNVDPNRSFTGATVRDPNSYVIHESRGVVESLDGPWLRDRSGNSFPNAVRVQYTTPTLAVPAAVKRAYAELIGHWYRQAKTMTGTEHQNLLQRTDGTAITQYPWQQSGGFRMPAGVKAVLDLYRITI